MTQHMQDSFPEKENFLAKQCPIDQYNGSETGNLSGIYHRSRIHRDQIYHPRIERLPMHLSGQEME